ncbi:hypothetical protein Acor_65170 [Acrocarpospora corrugata]|uniref:Uncharacterized protein n=1 Tax=Acrocarpospora corrugata TaxID=35763 RepID=A0A5M3W7X6_9ACTN|nr:hypothetical protein Acor_65170 [Acrocarpospora corrugata]
MLLRLAYLAVTNTFAALRLLPMGDRDKDVEILALRHQITILERQLGVGARARFAPEDRAFLAALLTPPPRAHPVVQGGVVDSEFSGHMRHRTVPVQHHADGLVLELPRVRALAPCQLSTSFRSPQP